MRDSKYSILFMRDDTDVRRFRISPFWLRGYLIAQFMLILVAIGSLYFGITSWHDNYTLSSEKQDLDKRLEDAELRLSTLGNMEKILEAYDKKELQTLLTQTPGDITNPPQTAVDLAAIFTPVDDGLVVVDEIKATFSGSKLTVNFKLENPKSATTIAGRVALSLVATDGIVHPLEGKASDLSFQIQKRKFVRATVGLPENLSRSKAFGLRISITNSDGKVIFGETYPFYNIAP